MSLLIVLLSTISIASTLKQLSKNYGPHVETAIKEAKVDTPPHRLFPYRLYGISSHSGSLCGGHYVAYVKHGGSWYYASDSSVSHITESQALNAEAYVLYYERVWDD